MSSGYLKSLSRFVRENSSAIAMFDRQMVYLAASSRWMSDFGLDQDPTGQSHYEVFPEIPEAWRQVHQRALRGETIRADHDAFVRRNGQTQWLQWIVWPWLDEHDDVGGILIATHAAHAEMTAGAVPIARTDPRHRPFAPSRGEGAAAAARPPPFAGPEADH